ncbi:LysE family transporter [uncultured Roseobacter sp.]|uniref:LysE family translocator n=1 Tax=uncultured Roseobacter sp. TaxID=114847 RepID=UPI002606C31D|nr:LysE family transporter [uncultured Roseobacter sp.]
MTLAALAGLALVQLMIAMSPGPAAVLTIRTAASEGARPALWLSLGLACGVLLWAMAALAGLSLVFELMPWVQTGLRVAGGLFLIWIGISLWRHAAEPLPNAGARPPRSARGAVWLGLWTNLANPKALAYFAAVFTGIIPATMTWWDGATILAVIFLVEIAWYACVALVFSRSGPRRVYGRIKMAAERCFGAVLGIFGARIAAG